MAPRLVSATVSSVETECSLLELTLLLVSVEIEVYAAKWFVSEIYSDSLLFLWNRWNMGPEIWRARLWGDPETPHCGESRDGVLQLLHGCQLNPAGRQRQLATLPTPELRSLHQRGTGLRFSHYPGAVAGPTHVYYAWLCKVVVTLNLHRSA